MLHKLKALVKSWYLINKFGIIFAIILNKWQRISANISTLNLIYDF